MPSAKFSEVPNTTIGRGLLVAIEHAPLGRRSAGAELDVDQLDRLGLLFDRARVGDGQVRPLQQIAELGAARRSW